MKGFAIHNFLTLSSVTVAMTAVSILCTCHTPRLAAQQAIPPKPPQVTINLGAPSRHILLPTVQAPAALGLTTFLVVSRWPRAAAVRALLLFAAATPAAAVVTAGLLSLTPWCAAVHVAGRPGMSSGHVGSRWWSVPLGLT